MFRSILLTSFLSAISALACGSFAGLSGAAYAHPHDAFQVMVAPKFDGSGRFGAVREVWTFNYDYSDIAKLQLDDNRDGRVDQAELDVALDYVLGWIPQRDFLTRITVAGRPVEHEAAKDVSVRLVNDHVVVDFTLPLKGAQAITGGAGVDVFDDTFYFALRFADPGVDAATAPKTCRVDRRWTPNADPIGPAGSSLNDPTQAFAVRVQIECSA